MQLLLLCGCVFRWLRCLPVWVTLLCSKEAHSFFYSLTTLFPSFFFLPLFFCTPRPLPVSVPTARGLLHTNLPQPPPQHVLALPFGPFLLALPAVRSDRELQEVAEQEIINTRSLAVISSPPLPASLATRACIEVRLGFIAREGFQAAVGLCCHFLFRVWQTT